MPGIGPIGGFELIIILVIVVLIFGVGKLPEVGGAIGRGIREFKENVNADDADKKNAGEEKPKA